MTLADQMHDAALEIFLQTDEMAETIAYTPAGGSVRNIPAIVDRLEDLEQESDEQGLMVRKRVNLHVSDDATQGVPGPTTNDTAVIDGVTYVITGRPEPPFAGIQILSAHSASLMKSTNRGYRKA